MPSSYTELKYIRDIVVWTVNHRFCIDVGTIENNLGQSETIADIIGTPVKYVTDHYELAPSADANTVDGVVVGVTDGAVQNPTIAEGEATPDEYFILARGPALINRDKMKYTDEEGVAFTAATLEASLAALGIRVVDEPESAVTETQVY